MPRFDLAALLERVPVIGRRRAFGLVAAAAITASPADLPAQSPPGEWRYWGGSPAMTRYSPLDQIDASNFERLEVAWIWRGDNFGPEVDYILRSTPLYANDRLFTVAGTRRTVVAIDPATGETLWTFREPHTQRWERSPRQNYGKGLAYAEIDGRGVVYLVTPGFFLHALDAETGRPLEGFGSPIPVPGFGPTGTVDLLADLGFPHDPEYGTPDSLGVITSSSPPIVVDGVIVVGNSHQTGRLDTREENIPGHILAYDARTGEHLWKFNVIPRPGEFGHDTWENDAWSRVGNVSSWAPMSADPERGIVYIPTDPPTNDYFGGFHPGANLFGNSILALDVRTGRRVWHFQTIHHDIWDWDNPAPPILLDVTVDGRPTPIAVQTTKQANVYTLNRATGEPVWPIEERPVPPSEVPGEHAYPTQPFPTRPAPYEMQGLREEDLIDFTPELRAMALEMLRDFRWSPALFNPPLHRDNPDGLKGSINCPGSNGGTNIPGGTVADPETGIIYVAHVRSCAARVLVPGSEADDPSDPNPRFRGRTGRTVARWVDGGATGFSSLEGLPIFKPPYGSITAIDMNTGEHLWSIPNGDTPDRVRNHPRLAGIELRNTGQPAHATAVVTRSLLMYGEGRGARPLFHAVDKRTGERIGTVELPGTTDTAPMTFLHQGRQFVVLAVSGAELPGSLVALRLPDEIVGPEIEITPFAGASVQIEHAGTVIHVDPWSRGDYTNAKLADLILVTDTPADHLDPELIRRLRKPGAPVVLPDRPEDARDEESRERLLRVPDPIVMDNGERRTLAGIGIEAVPMYDIIPGEPFHAKGEGNGYVLTIGGTRVYVAGVTECVPEIRNLPEIDIAFIPMNLPHGRMPPAQAAECVRAIGPAIVYPYHYREQPIDEFVAALEGGPIEVRLHDWYPPN